MVLQGELAQWAFVALYDQASPWLLRKTRRRFSNLDPALIEDVCQKALMLVLEKAIAYHGENDQSAKAWIWVITRNVALDFIDENRRLASLDLLLLDQDKAAQPRSVLDQCAVEQFLYQLSEREQQVVRMRAQGYLAREIAEEFGVSPARISQLLKHILEKWQRFTQDC